MKKKRTTIAILLLLICSCGRKQPNKHQVTKKETIINITLNNNSKSEIKDDKIDNQVAYQKISSKVYANEKYRKETKSEYILFSMAMLAILKANNKYYTEKYTRVAPPFIEMYKDTRLNLLRRILNEKSPEITDSMVEDLLSNNETPTKIDPNQFLIDSPVITTDIEPGRPKNKEICKNMGITEVFTLSKPGYNEDKNMAFIVARWMKKFLVGGGQIVLFIKKDGKWCIEKMFSAWCH